MRPLGFLGVDQGRDEDVQKNSGSENLQSRKAFEGKGEQWSEQNEVNLDVVPIPREALESRPSQTR
jgi:hypothetical protein